jgi:type IV pilus assembly protein PilM
MRRKQIFGLDISDHSIEAILLKKPCCGKPKIVSYARILIRGDVVNGVIKKPERLAQNIVKLLSSAQPQAIKTPYCILSLPESQAFSTIFKFPAGLRHEEIKNTIPFKAEEVIPFKSSEIYFDFKTIANKDGSQEVFYVAVPKAIVDSYIDVLHAAGLIPVAFDLESVSLARAIVDSTIDFKLQKDQNDSAVLLVDIGARTTNLNIFDHNGIREGAVVNVAGNRFTKSLMVELGTTEKEAEQIKIKTGFDTKINNKVAPVLRKEFKKIITETKKLINYYQDESGRPVGSLILAGGSSLLPKISEYLSSNLNLPAKIGNPLIKVVDPNGLVKLKNKAILFANVIGLSLRAISKKSLINDINLLPVSRGFKLGPNSVDKKSWQLIYLRLAILCLLVIIFGALLFLKNKNDFDIWHQVVSEPQYQTSISSDLDAAVLDALREQFYLPAATTTASSTATTTPNLASSTSTATTTQPLVKSTTKIKIETVSTGFLNVREGPGTNYKKVGQATSGSEYDVLAEQDGWYQIKVDDKVSGWVYSIYAKKVE